MLRFFRSLLAPNALEARAHRCRPRHPITIRRYQPRDQARCLELYETTAPRSLLEHNRVEFVALLTGKKRSFFVAENAAGEVVACGGHEQTHERIRILYYGLVDPRYRRSGIGTTLALARLAIGIDDERDHYAFIYALPTSIDFFGRMGFSHVGHWMGRDGESYPIGFLRYRGRSARRIKQILAPHRELIADFDGSDVCQHIRGVVRRLSAFQEEVGLEPITARSGPDAT